MVSLLWIDAQEVTAGGLEVEDKLFEGENTSLSHFVLGERLVRVHRMLTDPRWSRLGIGAIAFEGGFGDVSTFNQQFRQRFGVTPSDVRAAARRDVGTD